MQHHREPSELVGQYFLQVSLDAVWRQGRVLAVEPDGTMVVELIWWEPGRPSEVTIFTSANCKQFALFDTLEEMRAAYEQYHPGEIAELTGIAARGAVH
jgi:hypothetical protein